MSKQKPLAKSISDSNIGIITVLAAPLIGLVLVDAIILIIGYAGLRSSINATTKMISSRTIMYGHFMFAAIGFYTVILASRLGKKAIAIGTTSLVIAYLISSRYRGPWTWQGTFHWNAESQGPWLWSASVGIVAGLLTVLFNSSWRTRPISGKADIRSILLLAIAGAIAWLLEVQWPISSFIAPTLHFVLFSYSVVLTFIWYTYVKPESSYEESVHAY
ncbi:MAG TPA: hypothetical protein VJ835_09760 [Fimbriimonadaceae bacterium]|nr:hypothetical protein [Fimbriimonadaceae bacterium]